MRLVRRALAGAAASIALGALFTGVAIGAEPTTAEADADATLNVGLGAEGDLDVDAALDGILGVTDEAGTTTVVVDTSGDAALNTSQATANEATAMSDVSIGVATAGVDSATAGVDTATAPDADAGVGIDLNTGRASLAGAGMNAGSLLLIDLDSGRDDAVGGSADASARLGAATDAADATDATGATGDAVTGLDRLVMGAVLGIVGRGPTIGEGTTVGADEPTGGNGAAAPTGATGPTGISLPDTAVGAGIAVAPWGGFLVALAWLMASVRRMPSRRRR
jgi:hypothetical protein